MAQSRGQSRLKSQAKYADVDDMMGVRQPIPLTRDYTITELLLWWLADTAVWIYSNVHRLERWTIRKGWTPHLLVWLSNQIYVVAVFITAKREQVYCRKVQ